MKTLQVLFNLRVSVTVSWQKRSRWNCMCHDAGVLAYTLASWHGFRKMTPFSVTTHEFSTKVLRRGRTKQLKRLISLIKLYFNYLYIFSPTIFGIITPHISIVSNKNSISLHRNRTDEEKRVIARRTATVLLSLRGGRQSDVAISFLTLRLPRLQ